MNILIAPNSMKGCLSAFDFADTVEQAFRDCSPQFTIRKLPVADGGDDTGEILKHALSASTVEVQVLGPLRSVTASKYFTAGSTAIIEMADASGMKLVDSKHLNPLKATSYGTGQLMAHAMKNGSTEILLAIGGSATVDGGMGMMEALGYRFFDKTGTPLSGNGENLERVNSIQIPSEKQAVSVKIISDVNNVLLGDQGAARVFGPQKGASPGQVIQLENGLKNWASVLEKQTKRPVAMHEGSGAAGGIAVPLLSFFEATVVPGAEFVLDQLDFQKHLSQADIVITGEGKTDAQTSHRKAPFVVAGYAKEQGKPVFAFSGVVETPQKRIFDGAYSISKGADNPAQAMKNARQLLYDFSLEFAHTLKALLLHGKNRK